MEYKLDQSKTPLFDAYKAYAESGVTPFHVPGHKMGCGEDPEMLGTFGRELFLFDNTSLPQTDNLQHPCGPIKQAQELAADLYGAQATFFTVYGTSGAVVTMILSTMNRGEKIIIPRNVHKPVTAGIILAGAQPVYVQPVIDAKLGIAHCVTPESVLEALHRHPDAKAVLITSPTYYGVASDTKEIANIAHIFQIPLLVDGAHGAHLRFCPDELP
ncbi:MAG: aminotransferase class I/II-fold pyridoxal phosphate-dependent enzyme [Clostridia bacterium]